MSRFVCTCSCPRVFRFIFVVNGLRKFKFSVFSFSEKFDESLFPVPVEKNPQKLKINVEVVGVGGRKDLIFLRGVGGVCISVERVELSVSLIISLFISLAHSHMD